jgi:hypothetical protein
MMRFFTTGHGSGGERQTAAPRPVTAGGQLPPQPRYRPATATTDPRFERF